MGTHSGVVGHKRYFIKYLGLLGNVFVVWFQISDPISLMNIGCDKCCDVLSLLIRAF